jgi:hypothetical protein
MKSSCSQRRAGRVASIPPECSRAISFPTTPRNLLRSKWILPMAVLLLTRSVQLGDMGYTTRASREIPMDESAGSGDTLSRFEPADWHPDPEERYAQQERQRVEAGAVHDLRPNLRKVIEIRELQEDSVKETAQKLGISLAAAKARLFHARAVLRKAPRLRAMRQGRVRRAA